MLLVLRLQERLQRMAKCVCKSSESRWNGSNLRVVSELSHRPASKLDDTCTAILTRGDDHSFPCSLGVAVRVSHSGSTSPCSNHFFILTPEVAVRCQQTARHPCVGASPAPAVSWISRSLAVHEPRLVTFKAIPSNRELPLATFDFLKIGETFGLIRPS